MSDATEEEGSVGTVDKAGGSTVQLGEEDEEKGERGGLGKVAVSTNGALELGLVDGVGGTRLVRGLADGAGVTVADHDASLETKTDNIGGQVRVVPCHRQSRALERNCPNVKRRTKSNNGAHQRRGQSEPSWRERGRREACWMWI